MFVYKFLDCPLLKQRRGKQITYMILSNEHESSYTICSTTNGQISLYHLSIDFTKFEIFFVTVGKTILSDEYKKKIKTHLL